MKTMVYGTPTRHVARQSSPSSRIAPNDTLAGWSSRLKAERLASREERPGAQQCKQTTTVTFHMQQHERVCTTIRAKICTDSLEQQ